MASIARCLRAARPSALSALKTPVSRVCPARAFHATSNNALRKYTKEHEWIDLSADLKTGVIGISEYAAKELGDVVFVELPEEGKQVAAGDAIGAVESVKSAADINAPIACKITGINLLLEEKPATINQVPEDDSHGGGWIAKVQVTEEGVKDLEKLMDPQAYAEFTAAEGEH
ncbi:glycine cleavage H-protein-domain-containing protein [Podospora aff. communis PSN243]|jgi:glycine cleavage system H protein|uniref:Glycine cleavage system H protein n=1 Tax=Podospora aff. communis PSN243 TaxID=3040156 RepID=A0AAV9GW63_9PEZI|nr:glycine cleavage H-protein-domain-containing protein [Podospora aff. communis PSN243]